jgi:hypothetical protein
MGISSVGREAEGWYHANLYLSHPAQHNHPPLQELLVGCWDRHSTHGDRAARCPRIEASSAVDVQTRPTPTGKNGNGIEGMRYSLGTQGYRHRLSVQSSGPTL